jgi:hypothetical protein
MEGRAERMGNVAAQADVLDFSVLDSQQKEQKVRNFVDHEKIEKRFMKIYNKLTNALWQVNQCFIAS